MRSTIPAGQTERPTPPDPTAPTRRVDGWRTWDEYCLELKVDPRIARLADLTDFDKVLRDGSTYDEYL